MDSLKIRELFIFNTKLKSPKKKPSDDEAQDAKLLYYYPDNTEILVKRSNIGIVEGTLSFMQAFEKVDSNFLYTELNKTYFIADGYEDDFMIGFILDKENSKVFNKYENIETKKKWLKGLLNNFYNTFILFHNKLSEFFLPKENPLINLGLSNDKKFMLNDFVQNYFAFIETMKIPIIDNLQYFTMNSNLQAGLLLALQKLREKMPNLKMTSVVYKGKLIHNQLPFEAISVLYNIFFSSYECTPKYNTFSKPSSEDLKQITMKIENKEEIKTKNNKEKKTKLKEETKKLNKENKKEEKKEVKKEEMKKEEVKKEEVKKEEAKKEEEKKEEEKKEEEKKEEEKKEEEKKEEKKEEIKEEKKEEEKKEENKEEQKKENKIDENKTEGKDESKEDPNNKNEGNEIKDENKENNEINIENKEKYKSSPYRKIFDIKNSKLNFFTGIFIDKDSPNNYNIFVPNIYIKEFETVFQMIIYYTKDIIFFLFFDEAFDIMKEIELIEKIPKRINNYFKEQFDNIKELEKIQFSDNSIFCYKNSCNKSIKFSGFINKKNNNNFDWKLFETLQKSLFVNGETEMTSLSKSKGGFYIYFIHSLGQEVAMFFKDGLTLTQVKQEIEKTKKAHFDNLFLN